MSLMSPKIDKLVRRVTILATLTASYFLLTADYGPRPNALDPVSERLQSLSPVLHWQECLNGWSDEPKFNLAFLLAPLLSEAALGNNNKNLVLPGEIKKQILSAESTVKEYIFGSKKESQENHVGKLDSGKEHP